jgi:hypothetical protein
VVLAPAGRLAALILRPADADAAIRQIQPAPDHRPGTTLHGGLFREPIDPGPSPGSGQRRLTAPLGSPWGRSGRRRGRSLIRPRARELPAGAGEMSMQASASWGNRL